MAGKNFLKVTGILMIIGGGISILLSIIGLLGIAALAAMGASSSMLTISMIVATVSAVVELIAGILGVKHCDDKTQAQKCLTWGAIIIVLYIISLVLSFIGGSAFDFSTVISIIVSLVVPVLYIIGALKNKNA